MTPNSPTESNPSLEPHEYPYPFGRIIEKSTHLSEVGGADLVTLHSISVNFSIGSGTYLAASAPETVEGWYCEDTGRIALHGDWSVIFENGPIVTFQIQNPINPGSVWEPNFHRVESLWINQHFSDLSWSTHSRFKFKESTIIDTPTDVLEIHAKIGVNLIKFGEIRISQKTIKTSRMHATGLEDILLLQGMHRSGTSLVANLCVDSGITPLSDLMPGNEWNLNGYFESIAIVRAHDELLHALNSTWFDIRPLPEKWQERKAAIKAKYDISNIIKSRKTSEQISTTALLIKDPRLALVGDMWRDMANDYGWRICQLVVIRHPGEVSASLHARDGMTPQAAAALWWTYVSRIAKQLPGTTYSVVTYEHIINIPEYLSKMLAEELDLVPQILKPRPNETKIAKTVDTNLRHYKHTTAPKEISQLQKICAYAYEKISASPKLITEIISSLEADAALELDKLIPLWYDWYILFGKHHALTESVRATRNHLTNLVSNRP